MANVCYKLDDVNNMDHASFILHFGSIYEHSPWVAQGAWSCRPFGSLDLLHAAMDSCMFAGPSTKQMELIRSHPEFAGRLARLDQLTEASRSEQSQAGLDRLNEDEIAKMNHLNAEYLNKFSFPFIIFPPLHDSSSFFNPMKTLLTIN